VAAFPSWRRIIQQDYPSQYQDLIGQIALPINWGFDTIFRALSNGLTFASNIQSTINTFQVVVDANGNPTSNITINKDVPGVSLIGVVVVKAVNNTNSNVFPTGSPFVSYTETSNQIIINNISGLQPNNNYSITIIGIN